MSDTYTVSEISLEQYSQTLDGLKSELSVPLHFLNAPFYGHWQQLSGKKVIYYAVNKNDVAIGAGMAIEYPLPGGYHYLYTPYGPVLTSWSKAAVIAIKRFFKKTTSNDQKLLFVRLDADGMPARGLVTPSNQAAATSSLQPRNEWLLDVTPEIAQLELELHKKARYHIRLAERNGTTIQFEAVDSTQLESFYNLMKITSERNSFGLFPREYYQAVFEALEQENCAFLAFANIGGKPTAAALVVTYEGQAHYVFGCSDNEYRKIAPSYFLQWNCMQKAKQDFGATSYNFGGISDDIKSTHLSGVTDFKKRFGGSLVSHSKPADIVMSPLLYRAFSLYKRIQRTVK